MNNYVTFINKKIEENYELLKSGKFEDKKLYECITRAISDLKANPKCGTRIPKKVIPKEYKVNNLWKYDLPKAWRLIYTIKGTDIIVLSIILEWFSHKEYEKRFKY